MPASLGEDFNSVLPHTKQRATQLTAIFGDVSVILQYEDSDASSVVCSDQNRVTATNIFTDNNRDEDDGNFYDVEYGGCLYRTASSVTDL